MSRKGTLERGAAPGLTLADYSTPSRRGSRRASARSARRRRAQTETARDRPHGGVRIDPAGLDVRRRALERAAVRERAVDFLAQLGQDQRPQLAGPPRSPARLEGAGRLERRAVPADRVR